MMWEIAFGGKNTEIAGRMGYMELGQVLWFLGMLTGVLMGQRRIEYKRRRDFFTLLTSSQLLEEMQQDDTGNKGSGALERGTKALESALALLARLEQHNAVSYAGLSGDVNKISTYIEVAQNCLQNADRMFHRSADDILAESKYSQYAGNEDIKGFVEMTGGGSDAARRTLLLQGGVQLPKGTLRTSSIDPLRSSAALSGVDRKIAQILEGVGSDWDFDPLSLARETGNRALIHVGERVMVKAAWRGALASNEAVLRTFIREISRRYPPNDYHNEAHAANVAHMALWFATEVGFMDKTAVDLDRMALMIAALCHDCGHFSRNTLFCVNGHHTLSMIWNDSAPLENMHAAACFTVAEKNGCEIFDQNPISEQKAFRQLIIALILATDLKSHAASIMKFSSRREAADFLKVPGPAEPVDRWLEDKKMVGMMVMQCSDIGHAGLSWELHKEWSFRVIAEFFAQGDEEKQLGLPVSPLCERTGYNIIGNQSFFIDFLARSCIEELEAIAVGDGKKEIQDEVLKQCEENKAHWKQLFSDGQWDPLTHSMESVDYKHLALQAGGATKPPVMPYPMPSPLPPLRPVSTEELLHEITVARLPRAAKVKGQNGSSC